MIELFSPGQPALSSPREVLAMHKQNEEIQDMWKYAEQSMQWFGWGSPIGLGVFFISLSTCAVLLHMAGLWH
jgi:hypothetical protein